MTFVASIIQPSDFQSEIDKIIGNLSPEYNQELLNLLKEKLPKSKEELKSIFKDFISEKNFKPVGKFSSRYWIQRGWSVSEAESKKSNFKLKDRGKNTSMNEEYWMKKINPITNQLYTLEESRIKTKEQRPTTIEHWIKKGFTIEESLIKISEIQKKNVDKFKKRREENPEKYKGIIPSQLDYWIKKSSTLEEAHSQLSERQRTISLDKLMKKYGDFEGRQRYEKICDNMSFSGSLDGFIKRYGEDDGIKLYNEKCENIGFGSTLEGYIENHGLSEGTKLYNERCKNNSIAGSLEGYINRFGKDLGKIKYDEYCKLRKISGSLEGYIKRHGEKIGKIKYEERSRKYSFALTLEGHISKYGEIEGPKKYKKRFIDFVGASKESLKFFIPFYKILRKEFNLDREDIKWGIKGSQEYFLYDKERNRIFWYDLTIPKYKIIIEYHGKRFHPNPNWDQDKWNKWFFKDMKAQDKRILDLYKNNVAIKHGYTVLEVFSDETKKFNFNIVLDKIKEIDGRKDK